VKDFLSLASRNGLFLARMQAILDPAELIARVVKDFLSLASRNGLSG